MNNQDVYNSQLLDSLPLKIKKQIKDGGWKNDKYNKVIRRVALSNFIYEIFALSGANLLDKIKELHRTGVNNNIDYPVYLKKVESLLNLENDVNMMLPQIPTNV